MDELLERVRGVDAKGERGSLHVAPRDECILVLALTHLRILDLGSV